MTWYMFSFILSLFSNEPESQYSECELSCGQRLFWIQKRATLKMDFWNQNIPLNYGYFESSYNTKNYQLKVKDWLKPIINSTVVGTWKTLAGTSWTFSIFLPSISDVSFIFLTYRDVELRWHRTAYRQCCLSVCRVYVKEISYLR